MKRISAVLLAACSTSILLNAPAASYSDATGDFTRGSGFLDKTSVDVSNSGTCCGSDPGFD
jgi:hypothetical protein